VRSARAPQRRLRAWGRVIAAAAVMAGGLGCGAARLRALEVELLRAQLADAQAELEERGAATAPAVSPELLTQYLQRAGFPTPERTGAGLLVVPVEGKNVRFRVSLQHFPRDHVVYIAVIDYFDVDAAGSPGALVLLLTQLATINYELVLGKFQLNPRTGAVTLSVELKVDDGLGLRTFESALRHLIETADARYPELRRAAAAPI
jgi:hypothetical protein